MCQRRQPQVRDVSGRRGLQFVLSSLVHEEVIRLCTVCIQVIVCACIYTFYVCTVCNTVRDMIIAAGALRIVIL